MQVIAQLKRYKNILLDEDISLTAAKISCEYKIPMADSIVYATARINQAEVWTQDNDFKNLPNVKYFKKKKSRHNR
ncbi:MAG: PIN domain-containing protein [Candidatus Hydrogenedentota bacterium]